MSGELLNDEDFESKGQRQELNISQMKVFNEQLVQIIQIENLYNSVNGY